ncbi:facilitative glucose transporter, putative [Perkinsus marinus ATCC 50983]|uniref:Facilitative glucose transporter, putative n=1 Tax=Perkinsus marinus (strain ATCC 50983 / TXsc) TaxID=423536 RepID=C5LN37_PERM5|nr:facilitative glucose transporter, putative [Perkinsus marinus ATCC 50983]EER01836.1 facilitative glucose transporter, putative [Perkinsus marinus ATCC 50983]|eukprot:XP_002769118.1 facilitative glucose transporter, putative [Perkinsus marinus ATCC 50983]
MAGTRSDSISSVVTTDTYVERVIDNIGYGKFQYWLLVLCSVGYFAICAELLVVVFIQGEIMEEYHLSQTGYAFFPFLTSLLSMISSTLFGYLSDCIGRKWPFVITLLISALAGIASAFSWSFWSLVMFRCIVAIGLGGLTSLDYLVYVEFTPQSRRCLYSTVVFIGGCLGVLYLAGVNLVNLSFSGIPQWRVLLILAAAPLLPTGILRWYFRCETPRYLMSRRKLSEAHMVLVHMAKENKCDSATVPPLDEFTCRAQEEAVGKVSSSESEKLGFFEALGKIYHGEEFARATIPLCLIWLLQATAYWGLTLFLPGFLVESGLNPNFTLFLMVLCELPGTAVIAVLLKKMSMSVCLRIFQGCACLACLWCTLASYFNAPVVVAVASCAIYFFLIPCWCIIYVITPSVYPPRYRGSASGMLTAVAGVTGVVSPFISAAISESSEGRQWLYMAVWTVVVGVNFLVALIWLKIKNERKNNS